MTQNKGFHKNYRHNNIAIDLLELLTDNKCYCGCIENHKEFDQDHLNARVLRSAIPITKTKEEA